MNSSWLEQFRERVKNDPKVICPRCIKVYPKFMVVNDCCINCAIPKGTKLVK